MTRVLVALDESELSVHVARVAHNLFEAPGTEILAISVAAVPTLWADPFGGVHPLSADFGGADDLVTEEQLEARLGEVVADAGLHADETLVEVGGPVERICTAAEEHDVDVIVVGAHDKGFLRRMIDPSVSEGILAHTTRPVLVVHQPPRPHEPHRRHWLHRP
jgi:nucleotide-binding universal stress UspA family protein